MSEERLQKLIAHAGLASRRKAEEIIAEGRVTVDGQIAQIGQKADPQLVEIRVDGKPLPKPEHYKFILILIGLFFYGGVFGNTTSSSEESSNRNVFFTPDTLRMDTIIRISTDTIPDTVVIADCGLNIRFQDDNTYGPQYEDNLGKPRNSIISFCPPDGNSHLTFNFSAFSLETDHKNDLSNNFHVN